MKTKYSLSLLIIIPIIIIAACKKDETPVIAPSIVGKWIFKEAKGNLERIDGKILDYNRTADANFYVEFKADGSYYSNGDGMSCEVCPISEGSEGKYVINSDNTELKFLRKNFRTDKPDVIEIVKITLLTNNQLNVEHDKITLLNSLKASQTSLGEIQAFDNGIKTLKVGTFLVK